jgi:hypothetical protein
MRKSSHISAVTAQATQVDAQTEYSICVTPFLLNNASNPPFSLPSFYDNKNNHWVHQLRIGTALSNIAGVTLQ